MAVKTIHELAELGLTVAIPRGFEPHRVEKLFRESVKAILAKRDGSFAREDYVDAVSGRLLKMMRRAGKISSTLSPDSMILTGHTGLRKRLSTLSSTGCLMATPGS